MDQEASPVATSDELRREQIEKNQAALRLIESWDELDEDQQIKDWEELKRAIDENRPEYRKHFS